MKRNYILPLILLLFSLGGCEKDEIMLFEREEAGIYFQAGGQTRFYINIDAYADSIDYSFGTESDTVNNVILTTRIRTLGFVKDYDRPVKLSVDTENTTAVEGTHYEINLDTAMIHAGESELHFGVRFFRTADLLSQKVRLTLKLEENEHFKVYFKEQKNTNVYYDSGEQIMADRYLFIVSEIYSESFYWTYIAQPYLGPWTVSKFKFVNKVCEIPASDWQRSGYEDSKVQAGRFPLYALMVRNALQELADAGTPMRDDDGKFMQLGPNHTVDYSGNIE